MLYVAGGLLQIAGVLLGASPAIFPCLRRFARWLYPRYVRLENRLRRLVGRARPQRHTIGPADEINLADSLVPVLSPSKQLSLEETVAWLVRRAEDAQKEHAELADRLEEGERVAVTRADELQRDMEAHVAEALVEAHREYLPLRLIGLALLVAGVASVTIAAFVA